MIKENMRPVNLSELPTFQLKEVADSSACPPALRIQALLLIAERLKVRPRPPPAAHEVLLEVIRDARVPNEIRARAAMALLNHPAAKPPSTKEIPDE